MGSVGCLLISGLAEPVVKAYSLVIDLVDKYNSSQAQTSEAKSESMDSRRAFKSLVEKLEDSHTLELLVLPVMVKEVLLDLVKQSGLEPNTLDSGVISAGATKPLKIQERMERLMLRESTESQDLDILKTATIYPRANGAPFFNFPDYKISDARKQVHQAESPCHFLHPLVAPGDASSDIKKQDREVHKCLEGVSHNIVKEGELNQEAQHGENLLSTSSKQENEHLLKFFTAMGFNDEVVCRVLARTGPREPSEVLDLIQQEQDKAMIRVLMQEENGAQEARDEDFVLGVMKKAAASCGYTEDKVTEIYSNVPEMNTHELLLELHRQGMREQIGEKASNRKKAEETEEPMRNTHICHGAKEIHLKEEKKTERIIGKTGMTNIEKTDNNKRESLEGVKKKKQDIQVPGRGRSSVGIRMPEYLTEPDLVSTKPDIFSSSQNQPPFHTISPSICGPPQPTYHSSLQTNIAEERNSPVEPTFLKPKHKPQPSKPGAVITGQQRFLEGLQTPFVLQLKDDHADPGLRQIIIDGSNVAMT